MFSCQLHVCVFGLFKCPTKSPWLGVRHSCQLSGGNHASGDTALKAYRQSKASALESTAIPIMLSSFPIPKKRKTRWMWHLDLQMRENGLILNRVWFFFQSFTQREWKSLVNYECTQSIIEQCHFSVFTVHLLKNYDN